MGGTKNFVRIFSTPPPQLRQFYSMLRFYGFLRNFTIVKWACPCIIVFSLPTWVILIFHLGIWYDFMICSEKDATWSYHLPLLKVFKLALSGPF